MTDTPADRALAEYRRKRRAGRTPEPGVEAGDQAEASADTAGAAGAAKPAPGIRRRAARAANPPTPDTTPAGSHGVTPELPHARSHALPHGAPQAATPRAYVIHKHWATRLHFDLRLEVAGTMRSWAVPKGPSLDPTIKRMAVQVEDHPMAYNSFEGQIPEGEYGAGRVVVWDRGSWQPVPPGADPAAALAAGELKFELSGERLQGRWVLVRTRGRGDDARRPGWLLIKERDAQARPVEEVDVTAAYPGGLEQPPSPASSDAAAASDAGAGAGVAARNLGGVAAAGAGGPDLKRKADPAATAAQAVRPARASQPLGAGGLSSPSADGPDAVGRVPADGHVALPEWIAPQLATLAEHPPADASAWAWELKFDGYRLGVRLEGGRVRLLTRNGLDWTRRFPTLARALARLPVASAWLDGEAVALDDQGRPDFGLLQQVLGEGGSAVKGTLALYLFDLLHLDGQDLRTQPLAERRAQLAPRVAAVGEPALRFSQSFHQPPAQLLQAACGMGLEGIVGKRQDAAYQAGRSTDWLKLKCGRRQEFVVAGYTAGEGRRGELGALVLALPDGHDAGQDLGRGRGGAPGWRHAGNVGSGFDAASLAQVLARLKPLATDRSVFADAQAVQREAGAPITWVRPEQVVEVAFTGWTPTGRVRHGVFKGLREDKPAAEVVAEGQVRGMAEGAVEFAADRGADAANEGAVPMKIRTVESTPATASEAEARPAKKTPAKRAGRAAEATPVSAALSHPERVIDAASGLTKRDLFDYHRKVAPLILPHLARRPVALARAPEGVGGEVFFQKHLEKLQIPGVRSLDAALDPGHAPLLEVQDEAGLLGAVQMNAVEFHTWNATHEAIEQPDRFVLDLDPGEGVAWAQVQEAATLVRTLLVELGLVPFLKTSGGKGLHAVVPIVRGPGWDEVKAATKQMVEHLARVLPQRIVALSGPRNRVGRIFVDYLRNGRGATTVAAWSARIRPGLGISVPCRWEELGKLTGGAHWRVANVDARLRTGNGPWAEWEASARDLGPVIRRLESLKG